MTGRCAFMCPNTRFGCWCTREAVREVGSAIIVGIHNNDEGPVQRTRELTPKSIGALIFPEDMPQPVRNSIIPEGEIFDDFVIQTVIPEIEKRFPVETGRNAAAFCGRRLAGIFHFSEPSRPILHVRRLFSHVSPLRDCRYRGMDGSKAEWRHAVSLLLQRRGRYAGGGDM